jgi:glycosyltransferase involved in cell wall biosynthesis
MLDRSGPISLHPNELQINILGTRGVPGAHGGFETFATHFSQFLVERNINVVVYCQAESGVSRPKSWTDEWKGVRRVHFQTWSNGAAATIEFDLRAVLHVLRQPGVDLVLGYNTAIFCALQRRLRRRIAINMDGIEWKRRKWGPIARRWLWLNEKLAGIFATRMIADHPEISAHLRGRGLGESVMIPYGSEPITQAPQEALASFGLAPNGFFISICRIEPENSILELIRAFVAAKTGLKLVVLGNLKPENPYHQEVQQAANADVLFPGAVYEADRLQALRLYCRAYLHGHQVGGTNPSLVEALGAGSPVIAHDNPFNRWVAGPEQLYFSNEADCAEVFHRVATGTVDVTPLRDAARRRHQEAFTFEKIHTRYLEELTSVARADQSSAAAPQHAVGG